jgi:hypothetical protein
MDPNALILHTLVRRPEALSPQAARRRAELFWLETDVREARRRRRRELLLGAWNTATASRRLAAPEARQALR